MTLARAHSSIVRGSLAPQGHAPGRRGNVRFEALAVVSGVALAVGCGETLDELESGDAFSRIYESEEFQTCSGCHAPGAAGFVEGTEATQNWSTRDTAYSTLRQAASGMIGNFAACNNVPFLGETAEQSLLVAALDEDVRANYSNPSFPDCNADTISDQTLKIGGPLPAALLQELKDWIDGGAQ